ncbi:MAG: mannose-1-phosphate guanylyltransferase/mannose-6-phosphate isomerase [Deltaproteobacteria bacterium]|jgi:mannose-1-phosphate guanylyltransferase/mannose-6-phosphate isomerase|nr:mannose-1-phosphate guanylyltransferase/mannose-6-phosphate isomerase [Deltaproteobacteria bacterium]
MGDLADKVYAILLAGGTGTRLWPVSRQLYPKQLVKFIGDDSLVQSTIKRLAPVLDADRVRIVCGEQHFHETARHMQDIGLQPDGKIICEPSGRNTAPAILLGVLHILQAEEDAVLCVFPADHVIGDINRFHKRLKAAIRLADQGRIVTFGITPHYPETGYGYVEGGQAVSEGALTINRFVEKPDMKTARKYIQAGNFFWNSGMFAFKASVILNEFHKHQADLLDQMKAMTDGAKTIARKDYDQLPNISIDYAIMEKTDRGVVLPSDFGWSDIGSWKSLYDFLPKDDQSNVIDGDVITHNTQGCFIMGRDRLIATNHLENMVVVETPDSIFVSDIDHSRDVKSIVARLKEKGRQEYHQHRTIHFPWGSRTLLEQKGGYAVYRLLVYPQSTLQAEMDTAASMHLIVVKGSASVGFGGQTQNLCQGRALTVSKPGPVDIANKSEEPIGLIQVMLDAHGA